MVCAYTIAQTEKKTGWRCNAAQCCCGRGCQAVGVPTCSGHPLLGGLTCTEGNSGELPWLLSLYISSPSRGPSHQQRRPRIVPGPNLRSATHRGEQKLARAVCFHMSRARNLASMFVKLAGLFLLAKKTAPIEGYNCLALSRAKQK